MSADHLLHYTPGSEGYGKWRLECIGGKPHGSWLERSWPDEFTCRCTESACYCRQGNHGACVHFGRYIGDIDYECRCDEDPTECWTVGWFDEQGADAIDGDNWPEDVLPLPVTCVYEDGLLIRYCPAKTLIQTLEGR